MALDMLGLDLAHDVVQSLADRLGGKCSPQPWALSYISSEYVHSQSYLWAVPAKKAKLRPRGGSHLSVLIFLEGDADSSP